MEKQYVHTVDGLAVSRTDLNLMGEAAATADDRVYAELFRMTPFDATVAKGIVPPTGTRLIETNGTTGSVIVHPFRALVGARTAPAVDARASYRDIRSGLSVAEGATSRTTTMAIAANASGHARWDAVYAVLTLDVDMATVSRKRKNVVDGAVTSTSVPGYRTTTVTLAVEAGTPSATPEWPALPADSATVFNVLLGYIYVPNGAGAATQYFPRSGIVIAAPIVALAPAVGGRPLMVADGQYAVTAAQQHVWQSTGVPSHFLPASVGGGGETLLVALDLSTVGAESHANDSIVDSRDWRGRLCWYQAVALDLPFAWTTSAGIMPDPASGSQNHYAGWGQSNSSGQERRLAQFTLVGGAALTLYADATTGALKVKWTGTPAKRVILAMNFTRLL